MSLWAATARNIEQNREPKVEVSSPFVSGTGGRFYVVKRVALREQAGSGASNKIYFDTAWGRSLKSGQFLSHGTASRDAVEE